MEFKTKASTFSRSCRPSGFRNLDPDQIEVLHNASLEIMERTGMRFFDPEALTLFEKTLNGANIIHDLGYLDSAMTGSLELVAFCDEVIEWIKRYWQPFEISEESLSLDLIHKTGPDGHFLESDHTLRHFRELWTPALFDRMDFETWSSKGSLTLQQKANQMVLEIIGSHRAEPLPAEVKTKLADVVARK